MEAKASSPYVSTELPQSVVKSPRSRGASDSGAPPRLRNSDMNSRDTTVTLRGSRPSAVFSSVQYMRNDLGLSASTSDKDSLDWLEAPSALPSTTTSRSKSPGLLPLAPHTEEP